MNALELRNKIPREVIEKLALAISQAKEAVGRKGNHELDDWKVAEDMLIFELYVQGYIKGRAA